MGGHAWLLLRVTRQGGYPSSKGRAARRSRLEEATSRSEEAGQPSAATLGCSGKRLLQPLLGVTQGCYEAGSALRGRSGGSLECTWPLPGMPLPGSTWTSVAGAGTGGGGQQHCSPTPSPAPGAFVPLSRSQVCHCSPVSGFLLKSPSEDRRGCIQLSQLSEDAPGAALLLLRFKNKTKKKEASALTVAMRAL